MASYVSGLRMPYCSHDTGLMVVPFHKSDNQWLEEQNIKLFIPWPKSDHMFMIYRTISLTENMNCEEKEGNGMDNADKSKIYVKYLLSMQRLRKKKNTIPKYVGPVSGFMEILLEHLNPGKCWDVLNIVQQMYIYIVNNQLLDYTGRL